MQRRHLQTESLTHATVPMLQETQNPPSTRVQTSRFHPTSCPSNGVRVAFVESHGQDRHQRGGATLEECVNYAEGLFGGGGGG